MWIIQAAVTGDTNAVAILEKEGTKVNKALWVINSVVAGIIKLGKVIHANRYSSDNFPAVFSMPFFKVTPEEIFADAVPAFHANFISPREYPSGEEERNSARILASTIAKWYVSIRNVVLVALMVILLYIGIRIVISSAAEEKAKYIESLQNWGIALILVIFMHYIMAFAQTMTTYVTDMLYSQTTRATIILPEDFYNQFTEDANLNVDLEKIEYEDGKIGVVWPVNLMELAKIRSQLIGTDEAGNQLTGLSKLGYTFIYLIFVIYTLTFVITYLKRLVYLAFLTLIAPMVALTYPIDKLKDGQAQAFDMWIKEYMFNLLLQPMHLLLYTVLIGTAMDIATSNMLYAIAAMGFLMEAEQLMRKFFGFEKAATTGKVMGGVLGGAMAVHALQNIGNLGKTIGGAKKGGSGSGSGGDGKVKTVDPAERTADSGKDMDSLIKGMNEENGEGGPELLEDRQQNNSEEQQNIPTLTDKQQKDLDILKEHRDIGILTDGEFESQRRRIYEQARQNNGNSNAIRTQQNTPKTSDKQKRPKRKVIKGIGRVARTYGPGIAKKAARFTAKGVGAGILGMYGLAAGVASGDSSNILQYGAIGAGAGMALGNAGANLAGNAVTGAKNVRETFREGAYTSSELKQIKNEKSDKAFEKDKDRIALHREGFEKYAIKNNIDPNSEEDFQRYLQDVKEFRKYGVTDDKIITKAMNADEMKNRNERIALAKACLKIKDQDSLEENRRSWVERGMPADAIARISKNVRSINDF